MGAGVPVGPGGNKLVAAAPASARRLSSSSSSSQSVSVIAVCVCRPRGGGGHLNSWESDRWITNKTTESACIDSATINKNIYPPSVLSPSNLVRIKCVIKSLIPNHFTHKAT